MQVKRQSAVQWLWRWINDNQEATIEEGNIAFKQAKQLEKEQIINAFNNEPDCDGDGDKYYKQVFEDYYKK